MSVKVKQCLACYNSDRIDLDITKSDMLEVWCQSRTVTPLEAIDIGQS